VISTSTPISLKLTLQLVPGREAGFLVDVERQVATDPATATSSADNGRMVSNVITARLLPRPAAHMQILVFNSLLAGESACRVGRVERGRKRVPRSPAQRRRADADTTSRASS